jgi:hypothetical protein
MEPFILCDDCVTLTQWLTSKPHVDDVHHIPKSGASWLASVKICQMCIRLTYRFPLDRESVTGCDVTLQRDVHAKIAALDLEFRRDPEIWLNHKVYIWADEGMC